MSDDAPWYEALEQLAKAGALPWLMSDDVALFARHGFGVVATDDQVKAWKAIQSDPESGIFHVWRWGNRSGKTTALVLFHLWVLWRKWRYQAATYEAWSRYTYRSLHAAPLNKLVGKAHQLAQALIDGRADQQQDPLTKRYRPAPLGRFFEAGKSSADDGSAELWVRCANGAVMDFLSSSDTGVRIEGEAWWFVSWDEFARQAPVSDVLLLIDQTFLPRSSDHMAPVVMAGTSTEDFDPIYSEIEEYAERDPDRWVFMQASREGNFSQSKASIDRQQAMSFDPNAVARSLRGGVGEGGRGPFPHFVIERAFTDTLPARTPREAIPDGYALVSSFDHALRHDENVVLTVALPWPPEARRLEREPIMGVALDVRRGSRSLTPDEQFDLVAGTYAAYSPRVVIIDATAEGGLAVFRTAQQAGMPAVACSFTARTPGSIRIPNKEYGIQALQRLMGWGLEMRITDTGWVSEWTEADGPFGLIRFPDHRGDWARLKRQLAVYQRNDERIVQDLAMAAVMMAWWVFRFLDQGSRTHVQKGPMMGRRVPRAPRWAGRVASPVR